MITFFLSRGREIETRLFHKQEVEGASPSPVTTENEPNRKEK